MDKLQVNERDGNNLYYTGWDGDSVENTWGTVIFIARVSLFDCGRLKRKDLTLDLFFFFFFESIL